MSQYLVATRKVALLVALAILTCLSSMTLAQSDPTRTIVENYLSAQRSLNWKAAASYIAPTDLAEFKKSCQAVFSGIPGLIDTTILRPTSFGKRTSAEIASADSVSYYAGIYTTVFELYPVMQEMFTNANNTILGSVNEGDTLKHFTCRAKTTAQQEKVNNIEIVTLQKVGGKWYVMAKRSLEQMVGLLRRSIR